MIEILRNFVRRRVCAHRECNYVIASRGAMSVAGYDQVDPYTGRLFLTFCRVSGYALEQREQLAFYEAHSWVILIQGRSTLMEGFARDAGPGRKP